MAHECDRPLHTDTHNVNNNSQSVSLNQCPDTYDEKPFCYNSTIDLNYF